MTPAVQVRDLTVSYSDKPVLWDVNLDIAAAQLTAIVGPNGSGKSTLIKTILGLVAPVAGTISLFGGSLTSARSRVAYVPQRNAVDWDFPTDALDVVLMGTYGRLGWFRRPGIAEKTVAMDALARVGMTEFAKRQISELSGGQQQRVFIARALAQQADLLFLDEPLAGVDITTEETVLQILRDLRAQGKTVVVVHHDLETVRQVFDEVILLNVRLVASGPTNSAMSSDNLRLAYGARTTGLEQAPP